MKNKSILFLPPLENLDSPDIECLCSFIREHSKSFEFFCFDHITNDFRLGCGEICYLAGFADGVRFYEALKKGAFDEKE